MFTFSKHVLYRKRDKLQLLSSFVIQPNAPLVNSIIAVLRFCNFIFVTTPHPITVINRLSTNSATLSTEGCFVFA